ncbi:MAG: hypothetical protein P4L50_24635 [Anaerolineaceae bacterium]|nr:hypothetical protein [Anaerolineaceae bacterium]
MSIQELAYAECKRLGEAVICQAIRDANLSSEPKKIDAEMWILSEECRRLCDLLGLEYQNLITWLKGDRAKIDGRTGQPSKRVKIDSK